MAERDGAAMRRRQRRLRSWRRHEQQSFAAVLATESHHSYPKVDTANDCLRAQKTVSSTGEVEAHEEPPPGARQGILAEPGPQSSDRNLRRSSRDCLARLVTPSLAGAAGEGVDSGTLAFLLTQSLGAKEQEEQVKRKEEAKESLKVWKQRRKRVKDEFMALMDLPTLSFSA